MLNDNYNNPQQLASWLSDVARQDAAAFRLLYQATSPKLFGFALRILRKRELDFIRTLKLTGQFEGLVEQLVRDRLTVRAAKQSGLPISAEQKCCTSIYAGMSNRIQQLFTKCVVRPFAQAAKQARRSRARGNPC